MRSKPDSKTTEGLSHSEVSVDGMSRMPNAGADTLHWLPDINTQSIGMACSFPLLGNICNHLEY